MLNQLVVRYVSYSNPLFPCPIVDVVTLYLFKLLSLLYATVSIPIFLRRA